MPMFLPGPGPWLNPQEFDIPAAGTTPADVLLDQCDAVSTATLALTAATQVPLGAAAAQSAATLALTAPTQVPLQASAAVSTTSLAGLFAPGEAIIPLATSAASSSASLALTAKTTVPLGTSAAQSSASLALGVVDAGVAAACLTVPGGAVGGAPAPVGRRLRAARL